jgi:hypothetical protein
MEQPFEIFTPFLKRLFLVIFIILCVIFSRNIYNVVQWLIDQDKTFSIITNERQLTVTIPKGIASGPFKEPYEHPGYAHSTTTFFATDTDANPIIGGSSLGCLDSYERLIHIEVFGPGFLNFPTALLLTGPDAKPTRTVKHGENVFFEYDGNSSSKDQTYYLAGNSTIFKLTYLPGNCAWKDRDYSSYLDKILSSVKLSDRPMTQSEINETNKTLDKYEDAGIVQRPQNNNNSTSTQSEAYNLSTGGDLVTEINNSRWIVDDLIAKSKIKNENDCTTVIEKNNFDSSVIENQAIIYCLDTLRDMKTKTQQASPRQAYQVCGKDYTVQGISKVNNIDLFTTFANLTKNPSSSQKGVCSDFSTLFNNKTIGLDLKEQQGAHYLTMFDISDERYFQQIEVPTATLSYSWDTNAIFYFPSTLKSGNATYVGDIK